MMMRGPTSGLTDSHESGISNPGQPRRPRSLTQQSVGSMHAFSMFGSVDSEQSLPRTAPLATPEQEPNL